MKIRTSEVFRSFQGEGIRTGQLTIWVRLMGCTLNCDGFGQKDPTDPSTYILPYKEFDVKSVKRMEDLPVFEYGCDSSYSWSAKYKHLAIDYTEETLAEKIMTFLPDGRWQHMVTKNEIDLCFTGGEPMMQQKAIIATARKLGCGVNRFSPRVIQIETNATVPLTPEFIQFAQDHYAQGGSICFNVSPKLFTVSGEQPKKAMRLDIVSSYLALSPGCLKFVVDGTQRCWDELESIVDELRYQWANRTPIYIMPVGATLEAQGDKDVIPRIVNEAIARGYHISSRVHVYIFGNQLGT
jgi:7-carboxy-7-deazaguanine synthase